MRTLELDTEAGHLPMELVRRGIPARCRVHVVVEVEEADDLPLAAVAQAGAAFDWLHDEPDLYTKADILPIR